MNKAIKYFLLFCLSWFPIQSISAPQTIHIVTESWLGYTNEDGTGFYFDILKQIFPEENWLVKIDIAPFSRVRYLLNHERADMALGFYAGDKIKAIYSEQPVEVDSVDIALTPEMAENWNGLESLSLKKVQAMLKYRYDEFINVSMYYEESSSLLEMLDRVNRGHIDAVLDYKPTMLAKVANLSQPRQFVIIENVFRAEIYFVFALNAKGRQLKAHFDIELQKMSDSGELDRLFRQYVGPDANRL
ncbi:MAG: polar amino acid transport system substrate-binding protein [Shewanella sp.]|jgi:polar amino acid transport system substrate-binding protein